MIYSLTNIVLGWLKLSVSLENCFHWEQSRNFIPKFSFFFKYSNHFFASDLPNVNEKKMEQVLFRDKAKLISTWHNAYSPNFLVYWSNFFFSQNWTEFSKLGHFVESSICGMISVFLWERGDFFFSCVSLLLKMHQELLNTAVQV